MTPVDDYLRGVDPAILPVLEALRATIVGELGACDEVSRTPCRASGCGPGNAYGLPPRVVCGFAAWRHDGSFYPHSGRVLAGFAAETATFAQTRSALHFTAERPLPADLVRRLVRARLAELAG